MTSAIERHAVRETLALTTSLATTGRLNLAAFAGGGLRVPSGSSITTLTYYASESADAGASFSRLCGANGTALDAVTVAADRYVPLPDEAYSAAALAIVANAAGDVFPCRKT